MFCKLVNGVIVKAPKKFYEVVNGKQVFATNPSEAFLRKHGYKPLIKSEMPTCEENEEIATSYVEHENEIVEIHEIVERKEENENDSSVIE